MATTQRFGGNIEVWGDVVVKTQGATPESAVTRALLDQIITEAKKRANHTGTQTFSTISDGTSYVDGRIQQVVGAAPAALDTLEEIAARLAQDADATAAIVNQVTANRTDLDALTTRVTSAESDITDLRGDLDALTGTAGDLASQADLDAAVTALGALTTRVTNVEGRATAIEGRLDGLDTTTATLRTDVDAVQAEVTANHDQFEQYANAIADINGNVATRLDAAEQDIDALQTGAGTARTDIDQLRTDLDALGTSGGSATAQLRTDLDNIADRLATEEDTRYTADRDLNAAVAELGDRITALEIPQIFAATVGDGSATTFTINHPLDSFDVDVLVRENGQRTFPVDTVTGRNEVVLDFGGYVPDVESIRVVVKRLGDPFPQIGGQPVIS